MSHSSVCLFVCLSVGGKEELRPYWQKYMSRALVLVFVVDSSSSELFPVAKKHLHELLASDPLLPLMVLANKQVSMTAEHSTLCGASHPTASTNSFIIIYFLNQLINHLVFQRSEVTSFRIYPKYLQFVILDDGKNSHLQADQNL